MRLSVLPNAQVGVACWLAGCVMPNEVNKNLIQYLEVSSEAMLQVTIPTSSIREGV